MNEQSKSAKRRYRDGDFLSRYFVGDGLDVGAGPDTLGRYVGIFPLMRSVRGWDMPDGDAQTLATISDSSVDFVHSSHCLEHLNDPEVALKHWLRVIKPGGYLIATIPDEDMYERGIFPSRCSDEHQWTFTMHKPKGLSWSHKSINVLEMLGRVSDIAEVERVQVIREFFFDRAPSEYDLTLLPNTECAIEFVLRKRIVVGRDEHRGHGPDRQI
jgi:SAM-dependent methyltransferase